MPDKMMRVAGRSPEGTASALQTDESGNLKVTGNEFRENPFHTRTGQEVVSISENFWSRLVREGRFRSGKTDGVAGVNGSLTSFASMTPSTGTNLYPKKAMISCTVDAVLTIEVNTGVTDGEVFEYVLFTKAGTPLMLDFDGEMLCYEKGYFRIKARPLADNALVYGSISAVEVAAL